ncbi:NinX [Vibrio phage 1.047.O._10N.286.55.F2]|nr:NinX [Vibrio phage 1.047.O._10N.286.55.F2]
MNYEEWTSGQIAMAVAMRIEGVDFNENAEPSFAVDCFYRGSDGRGCFVVWSGDFESEYFDPCNNPSDAWPIILQTCMTIELPDPNLGGIGTNTIYNPRGTDWQCDYEDKDKCFRAAMICFLKMKDAEK